MNLYESYIRDRHHKARHTRCDAESAVLGCFDNGAETVAGVKTVAAASWRAEALTGTDHEGMGPVRALWHARETARRTLTDQTLPRHASPFAQGFATARIQGVRTFYRDTARLDTLTTRTGERISS